MPYVPLKLPPGVIKPGTVYDAKGRWYNAEFVRWRDGAMKPMGGWAVLTGAAGADVGGPVRGMLAWRRNNGDAKLFLGTNDTAYVYADGTLDDVTPGGFPAGAVDASGNFWSRTKAAVWHVDAYGEDLLAVAPHEGTIYEWDSSVGGAMTALSNAPTNNAGVVVTPERFVMALGAGGDPRLVQWSDQEAETTWTPTASNQAGDFPLATRGDILAGHQGSNETLIWTATDLFVARYVGRPIVYRFSRVGKDCGPISARSMAVINGWAMWMGQENFFVYDGSVRPIPCEVGDYVFSDLNRDQASKFHAVPMVDFNEIWFFYCSSGSTEIDRVAIVNHDEGWWEVIESFERTAGIDRGFLEFPIMADAAGATYFHENGFTYDDDGGSPSYSPVAESGPVELGAGDRTMMIKEIVPDEATLGDVQFSLLVSFDPTSAETTKGPFTAAARTKVRVTCRQVRVKITQSQTDWRFGTPRLDLVPRGRR